MENSECKMKACVKPMIISVLAVLVTLFATEYLIHGIWLMPLYQQTASLWRPMSEMGMFPWCIIRLLALSFIYSALYCKCKKAKPEACDIDGKKQCPIQHGLCFGILLGLLIGTMMASSYLWMPVPGELAIKWFIGGLGQGILVGLVLSCICSKKKGECQA